jgi:hypothetical protein
MVMAAPDVIRLTPTIKPSAQVAVPGAASLYAAGGVGTARISVQRYWSTAADETRLRGSWFTLE